MTLFRHILYFSRFHRVLVEQCDTFNSRIHRKVTAHDYSHIGQECFLAVAHNISNPFVVYIEKDRNESIGHRQPALSHPHGRHTQGGAHTADRPPRAQDHRQRTEPHRARLPDGLCLCGHRPAAVGTLPHALGRRGGGERPRGGASRHRYARLCDPPVAALYI